jgi:hypothetical protein
MMIGLDGNRNQHHEYFFGPTNLLQSISIVLPPNKTVQRPFHRHLNLLDTIAASSSAKMPPCMAYSRPRNLWCGYNHHRQAS